MSQNTSYGAKKKISLKIYVYIDLKRKTLLASSGIVSLWITSLRKKKREKKKSQLIRDYGVSESRQCQLVKSYAWNGCQFFNLTWICTPKAENDNK